MHKYNEKSALLIADTNDRASIAILRALKYSDVKVYIALKEKNIGNYAKYREYWSNGVFNYQCDNEKNFISCLISIKEVIGPFVLLPSGEMLLRWAIHNKANLIDNNIVIPTVDIETYELFSNKKSFTVQCNNFGLDIPEEIEFNEFSTFEKFVIKPKTLEDTDEVLKAPFLVENKKSFNKLIKQKISPEKHFIQKYIKGPSIYYCGCYNKGIKHSCFVQINLHQQPNGKSVIKAMPYKLPGCVISKIDNMMKDAGWHGVMMIELKHSLQSGKYYAIELNPRFWGPLQLSIDNGINFPKILLGIESEDAVLSNHVGYIWINGYFYGLLTKLVTITNFQLYPSPERDNIIYKDIWLRSDSFLFFILEPLLCFGLLIKELWKIIKVNMPIK